VLSLHAKEVARLPRHHGDPFDLLVVAQAMTEPICLLTAEEQLAEYS
jgi:PIN domain nuclease of toxin-antitoxin system